MIWSIVSKEEMEGCTSSPTFQDYEEALGKNNIRLSVVETNDALDFLKDKDIALLRTASRKLIGTIRSKHVMTTAELFTSYDLANDKLRMDEFLRWHGIRTPHNYKINELEEGKTYFVKPRFGSDSFGISKDSICHSPQEVRKQARHLAKRGIEFLVSDFIKGSEYTVACLKMGSQVYCYPMNVKTFKKPKDKQLYKSLCEMSENIFKKVGLQHHARIDFVTDEENNAYAIDVNLIPSLGKDGKWTKCCQAANLSYTDALNLVLATATKI